MPQVFWSGEGKGRWRGDSTHLYCDLVGTYLCVCVFVFVFWRGGTVFIYFILSYDLTWMCILKDFLPTCINLPVCVCVYRFRRCSFGELNMGLRCLGDWRGHDGQHYLALWDPAVTTHNQPRYRCAVSIRRGSGGRESRVKGEKGRWAGVKVWLGVIWLGWNSSSRKVCKREEEEINRMKCE